MRVLRPDSRVVETGGDGVRLKHLAVLVLHEIALHAVHDARHAARNGSAVASDFALGSS